MIKFENVTKKYGELAVVDNLTLEVDKGNLVALIGASGCGKTTTLKMVNRIIEPTSGHIYVNGRDILKQDPILLRRGIGYVIQQIGLFPNMTIAENITVVGKLLHWNKAHSRDRAEELLRLVDMDPSLYMNRYPNELSGGQQQRIGVLRALAIDPEIILMDEPFGALDPITREQLQNEFKNLQTRLHKTILFVTHDMDEALKMSDSIVLMRDGKIVQSATPEEMLRNPADEYVASFIGMDRRLRSPDEVLVEEIMIPDPVIIESNRGLAEGQERMRKRRVDSLMVVDQNGVLVGIVTIKDIQRNMAKGGRISDIVKSAPTFIVEGASVREAVYAMSQEGIGYLPVVDDKQRLKGLITRSSLVSVLSDVLWNNSENGDENPEKAAGEEKSQ